MANSVIPHQSKYPSWDSREDGSTAPVSLHGWVKGMNNVLASESLPKESLRNAVNIDINDVGKVCLRQGSVKRIDSPTGTMHSLWSGELHTLVIDGSTLYRVSSGALYPLDNTLTLNQPMSYLDLNGVVYYTNGVQTGIIDKDGVPHAWGVPVPSPVAPGVGTGALVGGRYSVTCTFQTNDAESGAPRPAFVDVSDGSSLVITLPVDFPAEVVACNVFVSAPNGTVEYLQGTYTTPGQVITLNSLNMQGRECVTKFMTPPPAGQALMYYRGRIYIASGERIYSTEPLRYGAVKLVTGFLMFPARVLLMAATKEQNGFFVSDENEHYFLEGAHEELKQNYCAPYAGIAGTVMRDELTDEPVWFTEKGWVTGKAEGVLEANMALSVAVPKYSVGATLYREENGLRQYVSSFPPPPEANQFSASDYIEAEVIRKGELV